VCSKRLLQTRVDFVRPATPAGDLLQTHFTGCVCGEVVDTWLFYIVANGNEIIYVAVTWIAVIPLRLRYKTYHQTARRSF